MSDYPKTEPTERLEEVRVLRQKGIDRREQLVQDVAAEREQKFLWVQKLVWVVFGTLETLLAFRILLKLIAANPDNPFARFIYSISNLFVGPFLGLVNSPKSQGMVLELSSIVAIVVYALAGILLDRIVWLAFIRPRAKTVSTFEHQDPDEAWHDM